MSVLWVNYDLDKAGQDYAALITYLKSQDSWAHPLMSSFFVKTSLSVRELRDGIRQRVDANDKVVVVDVSGQSWGTLNMPQEINDWLHRNL